MRDVLLVTVILISYGLSCVAHSEEPWLQAASVRDWGGQWRRVPAKTYLDLGDNSEALSKLKDKKFLIDPSTSGKSLLLTCDSPSKRYLVRSLYVGNLRAAVYETASGLIIGAGAFSEPRTPSKGAIAICLSNAPVDVRASVGFAK